VVGQEKAGFHLALSEEYLEKERARAEGLIKKAEKVIPGLGERVVVQDAAAPKTFERHTSMPEGAIYSFDQSVETRGPTSRPR
jgi:all-trans-retinol 13,14-reductase